MNYKIIALDLDGTLTNSKKIITPKTKEYLFKAQKNGTIVVLASGRPTYGITALAKELELEKYGGYILSYNGGNIISCEDNSVLFAQTLPENMIESISKFAKDEKVNILSYENEYIITHDKNCPYVAKEAFINKMPIREVDDFANYVNFQLPKCLLLDDAKSLAKTEQKAIKIFGDKLNVYRSEPYFLEIVPQNIDKAFSLNFLLNKLNLTKDNLICCGDGFNDLSMIKFAGLGVAMANAQQIVKEQADVVTLDNDSDGLVPIIEKYLL
ncbi:MAG: Cof-type HAD-IIB family hydrolase [Clostridia bacterium]